MIELLILFFSFLAIELSYFKIAERFSIIDKPNERSSHSLPTIRGGGILFPLSWLIYSIFHEGAYLWVSLGVFLIGSVSFADDRMTLSTRFRFLIHVIAFTLCFFELNLFHALPWWGILTAYVVGIGCVNAVNFMDGINGMTGLYALSVFIPLQVYWFNTIWNGSILNYLMVSIIVFGIFNFRKKARCFAGDVGSVSLGYILVFLLLGVMLNRFNFIDNELHILSAQTPIVFNFSYILLLALYGFDVILTLIQRLYLKENIFKAHRRHFYQLLVNEYSFNHIAVSIGYGLLQMSISYFLLQKLWPLNQVLYFIIVGTIVYSVAKWRLIAHYKAV